MEKRTGTIAIIDDSIDTSNAFGEYLAELGYDVQVIHSAAEGLAAVSTNLPRVIFCDVDIPRINGYLIAREVRSISDGYKPLLIATSSWPQRRKNDPLPTAGYNAHFAKPYDLLAVQALLDQHFDQEWA